MTTTYEFAPHQTRDGRQGPTARASSPEPMQPAPPTRPLPDLPDEPMPMPTPGDPPSGSMRA